ncbi:MAG: hypothetical protein AMK72_03085 [Planctomycetes bacterium SM23_25]|nr:MAG: hypothetical protein AMK72_03085 [Planctomycetes bacterium SM23_25]
MEGVCVDTHCHLTDDRLRNQVAAVLARARGAGVMAVVTAASDPPDAAAAAALARQYGCVYFTAGVHPHQAKQAGEGYLDRIEELAAADENVAIGEIGLDYHYDFSPRDVQRRVFAEQLELAKRLGKPVVIHTREAFEDTLAILREAAPPGEKIVFHSYTGDAAGVRRVLDLGAYVGFSGIATFNKSDSIRRAAAVVGDDRILVETDAPYLSPEQLRKMRTNEPANVVHVAECLAAVRRTTLKDFGELTTTNAVRLFGLDISP